jgi:2-polyprenyl-6-methoxyphenol hydroxylase-like FAD-dependent oxidoreductase
MASAVDPAAAENVGNVTQTSCCVVGAGPGGMVLALLLSRRGVPVTLLEAHKDFEREFRGDSLHPAILEILDEIGLAERLQRLPHVKIYGPAIPTSGGPFIPFDLRRIRTRFPYILFMHQPIFLDFLATEAAKYPHFRLVFGANVQRLIEDGGVVRGVRYRATDGWHEVLALLTVGADGRFSRLRHLVGFEPRTTAPPIDLLWLRLPRLPDDPQDVAGTLAAIRGGRFPMLLLRGEGPTGEVVQGMAGFGGGRMVGAIGRGDHWQVGVFIPNGQYQKVRAAGLEALRRSIVDRVPFLARQVEQLTDWRQVTLLSVASSYCRRWYKPGLLLIGDAAHVMSPFAGAGIKYAIEDAVVAANVLAEPLKAGRVRLHDLGEIQRQRQWPPRFIQAAGAVLGTQILRRLLHARGEARIPRLFFLLFRLPLVSWLVPRLVGIGLWRVHVRS